MPSSPDDARGIKDYRNRLKREKRPAKCPTCRASIPCRDFEQHCLLQHGLQPKLCCVWCEGKTSWPEKEKLKNASHLVECWQHFMIRTAEPAAPDPTEPDPSEPEAFDATPAHPRGDAFGHPFDPPPARAFDLPQPLPLRFDDLFGRGGLGKAVACVRRYLDSRETHEWFHALVRTPAHSGFLEATDADGGETRILPFSCWCDGGAPEEDRFRQHRHLIAVAPKGHFRTSVWNRIRLDEDRPRKNFKCVHLEEIASAMHLVNTLGYLSQRKSKCAFGKEGRNERDNHFHLSEGLPSGYRLPCVLQWDGGVLELVEQEQRNAPRRALVEAPAQLVRGRWRLLVRDVPGVRLHVVLPVRKAFEPCPEATPHLVHLVGGRRLHFRRNAAELLPLSSAAWLRRQAGKGNLFYAAVGGDLWTPRKAQQVLLHAFRPLATLVSKLLAERQALTARVEELEAERERAESAWRARVADLELEVRSLRETVGQLRRDS